MLDAFTFLPFHRERTLGDATQSEVGKRVRDLQTRTWQLLGLEVKSKFRGPSGQFWWTRWFFSLCSAFWLDFCALDKLWWS